MKGRGKFPKRKQPELPPPTPNITRIAALQKQDASDKALELLHEVATLVSPVMHHYGFKVGLLCEMYPKNQGLLGLNVNHGQKVCLRLRSPTDPKWFLDTKEIVETMLHELTHNVFGPHDNSFYKKLDELRDKYMEFQAKRSPYGNNFSAPPIKLKQPQTKEYTTRVAKVGSNKISVLTKSLSNSKMRDLLLRAAERRLKDAKLCAQTAHDISESVPHDDELSIIDVVSLDSDTENDPKTDGIQEDVTVKTEEKPKIEVIIID